MSAQDHLSAAQFYHGSRHAFGVGDVVRPASALGIEARPGTETDQDHAYATDAPDQAQRFADTSAHEGVPRVYQVEPVGRHETGPLNHIMPPGTSEYRTSQGWRVTGVEPVTYKWPREGDEPEIDRKRSGLPGPRWAPLTRSAYLRGEIE